MASRDSRRPNIMVILSDDQGCWALGCAGNREIRTPSLDALAAAGMRFENAFCASPVCSPARASLMTGRMPSAHGVHDYVSAGNTLPPYETEGEGVLIEYLRGQPGYTDQLAAAGYACGLSGKWHLGDSHHPQKSFGFWAVHARGGGAYYGAPMVRDGRVYEEPRYVTDAITDNALLFLEQQRGSTSPFCLNVHYTAPHAPWQRQHHPADIFDSYFSECPFRSVPDGLTPPPWVRHLAIPVRDAEQRRTYLSGYFAAVTAMDAAIGRLLRWLDQAGLRESTLVVFTGDNGMNMGHHGVYGKGNATFPLNMLEESVKVPFIASWPGRVPAGRVSDALASHCDLFPTLLDCAGVEPGPDPRRAGRTLLPVLLGCEPGPERPVFVCDEYGPVRMVRTREWKYVHRYPYGPHELYHLAQDSGEERNLAGEPGYRGRVEELRALLEHWFARHVDAEVDGLREAVCGSGQRGLAGLRGAGRGAFRDDVLQVLRKQEGR